MINPGGSLPAEFVIGRDAEIAEYWHILARQSIALLAPRRVGKTSICNRMAAFPPAHFTPVMRNLEGLEGATEFVRHLTDDVDQFLSRTTRAKGWAKDLWKSLVGGIEAGGVKLQLAPDQWKVLLDQLLAEVNDATPEGSLVVFFWDEFTLFFGELARRGHAQEAMVLLDRLRAARQRFPRLRMVLTGSIGFEEVLEQLRAQGYANDPINDVSKQIVPLLSPKGALELANTLLTHLLSGQADAALAACMAERSEGHPLVIQHMADRLRRVGRYDVVEVEGALQALIADASDPLELSHYLERLATYLPSEALDLTRLLLDTLAAEQAGVPLAQLVAVGGDKEAVLKSLNGLRKDQYLVREGTDHRWRFRLDVLRRWWKQERGL
jgi:hypothetical protein